jgi:hypothetical protein
MISIEINIKEIPKTCNECKFLQVSEYRCHNEKRDESSCLLGYMSGKDMRDINFRSGRFKDQRFSGCQIENSILP